MFRPNVLQGEPRAASLGALWIGKFEKLPSSKLVDIVWEAPESSRRVFWSHELLVIVCLAAWVFHIWLLRLRSFFGFEWQVQLQGTALTPMKPKVFLTCTMVLGRDEWVKLD